MKSLKQYILPVVLLVGAGPLSARIVQEYAGAKKTEPSKDVMEAVDGLTHEFVVKHKTLKDLHRKCGEVLNAVAKTTRDQIVVLLIKEDDRDLVLVVDHKKKALTLYRDPVITPDGRILLDESPGSSVYSKDMHDAVLIKARARKAIEGVNKAIEQQTIKPAAVAAAK